MAIYHLETMSLAAWEMHASPEAEQKVSAVETVLDCRVPASLRELLSSDGWPAFLEHFSNEDHPFQIDELTDSRWPGYEPVRHGILPFMVENQGVCTWAVVLDGRDDPEVVVEVDSGTPPTWKVAASSFSLWVRCQVLDHVHADQTLLAAQGEPLSGDDVKLLERRFESGPCTYGWPGDTIYRFSSPLGSLLLWSSHGQCDWWIAPHGEDTAVDLLNEIPSIRDLYQRLYALKPEGKAVLKLWRQEHPA